MNDSVLARELGRYLDAIVDLTRQNDSQMLLGSLLDALCEGMQARRVRLLAITNDNRDTEFSENNIEGAKVVDLFDTDNGEPVPIESDADLLACVRTRQIVSRDVAAGRRVVFPVFGMHDMRALLVLEDLRDGSVSYELLAKLLRVYSNQAVMLSRTELDPLTGLYNRQSFFERVRRVGERSGPRRRVDDDGKNRENCFALFDIDFFKLINDRYGHLYGDEVLLLFARLMTRSFRADDLLFRYGGEEFAAVLVGMDLESAGRVLERFRATIETHAFPQIERITVSIGFAAINLDAGVDKIVMCADRALYYAKNHGRNQVRCYETLVAAGELEPVQMTAGDIELF